MGERQHIEKHSRQSFPVRKLEFPREKTAVSSRGNCNDTVATIFRQQGGKGALTRQQALTDTLTKARQHVSKTKTTEGHLERDSFHMPRATRMQDRKEYGPRKQGIRSEWQRNTLLQAQQHFARNEGTRFRTCKERKKAKNVQITASKASFRRHKCKSLLNLLCHFNNQATFARDI